MKPIVKFLGSATFLSLLHPFSAIPVDNGVDGEPEIECGPTSISISFNTRNNFDGHVFVKGLYAAPDCRDDRSGRRVAGIELPFSSCNTRRVRSLNPKGVFVSTTVIISFHPLFLTKVDRAYKIQCFYMEADKTVSTDLEVSMLTTNFQTQLVPMPICRYEILDGGPSGPSVQYTFVGQKIYHKWSCDTETVETFCMVIHSCYVDDTSGDQVDLIGTNGCAADRHLINNIDYLSDLMAGVPAHVFKYADRSDLYFQCQITILVKEPFEPCPRPRCPDPPGRGAGEENFVEGPLPTPPVHEYPLHPDSPYSPDGSSPGVNRFPSPGGRGPGIGGPSPGGRGRTPGRANEGPGGGRPGRRFPGPRGSTTGRETPGRGPQRTGTPGRGPGSGRIPGRGTPTGPTPGNGSPGRGNTPTSVPGGSPSPSGGTVPAGPGGSAIPNGGRTPGRGSSGPNLSPSGPGSGSGRPGGGPGDSLTPGSPRTPGEGGTRTPGGGTPSNSRFPGSGRPGGPFVPRGGGPGNTLTPGRGPGGTPGSGGPGGRTPGRGGGNPSGPGEDPREIDLGTGFPSGPIPGGPTNPDGSGPGTGTPSGGREPNPSPGGSGGTPFGPSRGTNPRGPNTTPGGGPGSGPSPGGPGNGQGIPSGPSNPNNRFIEGPGPGYPTGEGPGNPGEGEDRNPNRPPPGDTGYPAEVPPNNYAPPPVDQYGAVELPIEFQFPPPDQLSGRKRRDILSEEIRRKEVGTLDVDIHISTIELVDNQGRSNHIFSRSDGARSYSNDTAGIGFCVSQTTFGILFVAGITCVIAILTFCFLLFRRRTRTK